MHGWTRLVDLVVERFTSAKCDNIKGEFNKLKQVGSVDDYTLRFEELKSFMKQRDRHLNEEYFIKNYLSGLKYEI